MKTFKEENERLKQEIKKLKESEKEYKAIIDCFEIKESELKKEVEELKATRLSKKTKLRLIREAGRKFNRDFQIHGISTWEIYYWDERAEVDKLKKENEELREILGEVWSPLKKELIPDLQLIERIEKILRGGKNESNN